VSDSPQPQCTKPRADCDRINNHPFHASLVLIQFKPPRTRSSLMADLIASYHALSASSQRADVSNVLNAIISCPSSIGHSVPSLTFSDLRAALSIDNANRAALVTAILPDIGSCEPGRTNGRLHHTGTYSHSYFPTISKSLSQMFISHSRPSRLWVVIRPDRPS